MSRLGGTLRLAIQSHRVTMVRCPLVAVRISASELGVEPALDVGDMALC